MDVGRPRYTVKEIDCIFSDARKTYEVTPAGQLGKEEFTMTDCGVFNFSFRYLTAWADSNRLGVGRIIQLQ